MAKVEPNEVEHEIGDRLRELRRSQRMSLRDLASSIGVSASALSQIENGAVNPSVDTLLRLADRLSVSVGALFADEPTVEADRTNPLNSVVRADARKRIHLDAGITWESLLSEEEPGLEWFIVEYPPDAGPTQTMVQHNGREYGLVLLGTVIVKLGFMEYELGAGDSIAFDATTPHQLRNGSSSIARGAWTILGRNSSLATTSDVHS